jgi:hypothetical protein
MQEAILSNASQGVSLLLENVHDIVDGMTAFELSCEGMIDQSHPCLFLIALEGGIEK